MYHKARINKRSLEDWGRTNKPTQPAGRTGVKTWEVNAKELRNIGMCNKNGTDKSNNKEMMKFRGRNLFKGYKL